MLSGVLVTIFTISEVWVRDSGLLGGQPKEAGMARVTPFHSKAPNDPKVYHDDSECTEGNNIEPENKVSGTGGYPRCKNCN
jgi:hypothetical protein